MKKKPRTLAALVCALSILSCGTFAFAAETPSVTSTQNVNAAGNTGTAQLELTVVYADGTITGDTFSAVVPAVLPISGVTESSEALCPTNAKIVNNNVERAIEVSDITMRSGSWAVVDYDSGNFENGTNVSMSFNGCKTGSSGVVDLSGGNWEIPAGDSLALDLSAKISKQTAPISATQIATVSFTLGWAN